MGKRPEGSRAMALFSAARFLPWTSTLQSEAPHSPTSQVQTEACPGPSWVTRKSMRVHCGGSGASPQYQRSQRSTVRCACSSAESCAARSPRKKRPATAAWSTVQCEAMLNSATSEARTLCLMRLSLGAEFSIHMTSLRKLMRALSCMTITRCSPTTPGIISCTRQTGLSHRVWSKSFARFLSNEAMPRKGKTSEPHQLKPSFTTPLKSSTEQGSLPQTVFLKRSRASTACRAARRPLRLNSA
mmetsp:Transcript_445/g.1382  ORF Transcript_445/g.1382 Transcript_445/m.1382 type:complete len:243 (-) Transcript_445:520-1248(-)